LPEQTEALC